MNLKAMAVVAGAVVASTASGDAVQWRVQDGGNGHWYEGVAVAADISWDTAKVACEGQGGHLATLTSPAEDDFVWALSRQSGYWVVVNGPGWSGAKGPWLGLHQAPGSPTASGWSWVTGEPFTWAHPSFVPNDGCTSDENALNYIGPIRGSREWNDFPGDVPCEIWGFPRAFIIEWSADCNNDGVVDYGQCRDGSLPDFNGNNIPDCCEQGTACTVGSYPVEWRVADGGNGHWYEVRSSGLPPFDARNWQALHEWAAQHAAELCSIGAAGENAFVQLQVQSRFPSGSSWSYLGATQDASQSCSASAWLWLDGTPWSFQDWQVGQPNCLSTGGVLDEPRLAIRNSSGSWGDWSAKELTTAVIEWSADCNNDGIVDYGQILNGELADTNGNGVPDVCEQTPCAGDIATDGVVNGVDLAAVLNNWGTTGGALGADANGDGVVDGADLALVLNSWGPCPK